MSHLEHIASLSPIGDDRTVWVVTWRMGLDVFSEVYRDENKALDRDSEIEDEGLANACVISEVKLA